MTGYRHKALTPIPLWVRVLGFPFYAVGVLGLALFFSLALLAEYARSRLD